MGRNCLLGACLLTPLFATAGLTDAPVVPNALPYDEIETVCRRAASGTRADLVPTLTRAYTAVTNMGVRETLTTVLGVNALCDRKDADAARFREHLRVTFPQSKYQPLLNPPTNTIPCATCEGKGRRKTPCLTCGGTGKCLRCSGRGSIPRMGVNMSANMGGVSLGGAPGSRSATLAGGPASTGDNSAEPCIVCKGSGKCKGCDGQKVLEAPCSACQGRGQIPSTNFRPLLTEMLLRLADEAFIAGQRARGRSPLDGKWLDAADYARASRKRREDFDFLARAAAEASDADSPDLARKNLQLVAAKFPDEPAAWHARQLLALVDRDEAAQRTRAEIADRVTQAAADAPRQIPLTIQTVLETRRMGGTSPAGLITPDAVAVLPEGVVNWRIEAPLMIGRTARAAVVFEQPTRSGLTLTLRRCFLLFYGESGWCIDRIDPA